MHLGGALHLLQRDHLTVTGPPPGTVPNYIDPPSNATTCLIVSIFTLVLAFILVVFRIVTKAFIVRKFGWDDRTAILAMLLAAARVICMALAISRWGFGRHIWDVPPENNKMLWRLKAIGDTLYPPAMMCAKTSILLFYLQMFRVKKWFRYTCWVLIVFVIGYLSAFFFVYLFYCTPEKATWNYTLMGKCVNGWAVDIANGALNIFSDSAILILPLPMLWHLQLSIQRKLGVSLVFLVGAFTVAASIARETVVATLTDQTAYDATWLAAPESLWLTVEMNVSIICGSLLILPRLFQYLMQGVPWDHLSGVLSSAIKERWYSESHSSSGHRPKRRDQFHKQGSEVTLELGEVLAGQTGRTDTVVEVPSPKAEADDWERETIEQGTIKETRTYTVT